MEAADASVLDGYSWSGATELAPPNLELRPLHTVCGDAWAIRSLHPAWAVLYYTQACRSLALEEENGTHV